MCATFVGEQKLAGPPGQDPECERIERRGRAGGGDEQRDPQRRHRRGNNPRPGAVAETMRV
jgi:hypothetical protein